MPIKKISIPTRHGTLLNSKLEVPANGNIRQYAIFAHCFTCSSSLAVVRHISRTLTGAGIAVLRFDFTGLGRSEGEFADTNFSNDVSDLIDVSNYLEEHYAAPQMLIGHSLGGTSVLMAAFSLPEVKAVATIGSPSDPTHLKKLIKYDPSKFSETDAYETDIGGRPFKIKQQFVEDLEKHDILSNLKKLNKALLIMHSPVDETVSVDNAAQLFKNALHPKSFVSLDRADHLLTKKEDAIYAAEMIGAWASRYIDADAPKSSDTMGAQVVAHLNMNNKFTTQVYTDQHHLIADEPSSYGGDDLGFTPYQLLSSAIATCTAMTIKMYAAKKKWDLQEVCVYLTYSKKSAEEVGEELAKGESHVGHFHKTIRLMGDLDETQRARLKEISSRCPVQKTVSGTILFDTELA